MYIRAMRRGSAALRFIAFAALMFIVGLGALVPAATTAAQRQRCFRETGFCIAGNILAYWERNGGLPIFGYPISEQRTETVEGSFTGPVQWFERDRLEDHSSQGLGVLTGRLGVQYLDLIGGRYNYGSGRPTPPQCSIFPQTGHDLCGRFRAYWERNGGVERFGYPVTQEMEILVEGRRLTVQYFERRRMEYHPENAGTQYEILLGLLGREVRGISACPASSARPLRFEIGAQYEALGCPTDVYDNLTLVAQPFERGYMVWAPAVNHGRSLIFIVARDRADGQRRWRALVDTYQEGEQIGGTESPPPGLYAPVRGFGKVWWSNPTVREALGWATAPEASDPGAAAFYVQNNAWLVYRASTNQVAILPPDGTVGEPLPR